MASPEEVKRINELASEIWTCTNGYTGVEAITALVNRIASIIIDASTPGSNIDKAIKDCVKMLVHYVEVHKARKEKSNDD